MPEYLSPGVYVEEIDAGPRPIASVSTSMAGMVGVTARGPTAGKPVLVTNFLEYRQTFGGFVPEPPQALRDTWQNPANEEGGRWWLFPLAVKGFFDNGGRQLFVKRVAAQLAAASTVTLQGGILSDVQSAPAGATQLTLEHLVGVQNGTQLTIRYRDGGNPPTQIVQVSTYNGQNQTVTFAAPGLTREVRAGRAIVQIALDANPTMRVTASARGSWGDGIRVRVRPNVTSFSLLADPAEGAPFATQVAPGTQSLAGATTVVVSAVPGLAVGPIVPPLNFFVGIGPGRFEVSGAAAVPAGISLTLTGPNVAGHRQWDPPLPVRRVRRARAAGAGTTLRVAGASRLYTGAVVELDNGTAKETVRVAQIQGDVVTFATNIANAYFETDKLRLIEAAVTASFTDEGGGLVEETIPNARLAQTVPPDPLGLEGRINGRAQLITVTQLADLAAAPLLLPVPSQAALDADGPTVNLAAGNDNFDTLAVSDFVGADGGSGQRTGIESLVDIDQVAICAVPGMWSGTVQAALIQHCEELKDRFAIVDPKDDLSVQGALEFRNRFDTRYAALYHPWLRTLDPATNRNVRVPPSGHIAGVYARVDIERGVHKAPANVTIRGILPVDGLGQDITKRQQDLLNPAGVNALRAFPGLGQRVWGARTLTLDTQWRYVNVRRLFLMVEESIDEGTQWVVFEPNDEPLWALVRQSVANYLTSVWRTGALAGTTPDEAFFVACDRTTMTQDDIDQGRLICVIGIAPVFPAEFVIFRIQQKTRELAAV